MSPSSAGANQAPIPLMRNDVLLDEECPWCEQPISRERLRQIQEAIRTDQERKANELESRLREEFAATREAERVAEREEAERVVAEKIQAARAEARGEALSEMSETLSNVQSERDRLDGENAELAQRCAGLEASKEALVAEAIAQATHEVREALDKEHQTALATKEAEAFAERQQLQRAFDDVKRKLDNKTAEEWARAPRSSSTIFCWQPSRVTTSGASERAKPERTSGMW